MRLEFRFVWIITFCLVIGLGVASLISYKVETRQAEAQIIDNAELLMGVAMAIRTYTIKEVRPLLNAHTSAEFRPQTVPSYSAQTTIANLKKDFPDFTYREVALNPTNVEDRASAWEVSLIRKFQTDSTQTEISGVVEQGENDKFYVARPIRITNASCLACHSTPENAPASMLKKYGSSNGFGWRMNEVVGAQIVEVPTDVAWTAAKNSMLMTIGSLVFIFLMTFVVFMFIFRRYVSYPLEIITRVTEDISLDKCPEKYDADKFGGQFETLEKAIDRLRVSVKHAVDLIGKRK